MDSPGRGKLWGCWSFVLLALGLRNLLSMPEFPLQFHVWRKGRNASCALTLAELHVLVLTSIVKLIKLLQNLMKLLPNHIMVWWKFYHKLISDIIVNDCTTKKILKSQYIFKNFIYFIFNWSVYPLISSTKSGPQPELEVGLILPGPGLCGWRTARLWSRGAEPADAWPFRAARFSR